MIGLLSLAFAQPVVEEWSTPAEPHTLISSHPGMVVFDGWGEFVELDLGTRSLRRIGRPLPEPMAMSLGPTWGDRRVYRELDAEGIAELRDIDDDSVILHGGTGPLVPDIDGDGLPDIHGKGAVHLQRGTTWLPTAYPLFESEWNYYRLLPVGDLTGDGRGDLLIADDTDWALAFGASPSFGAATFSSMREPTTATTPCPHGPSRSTRPLPVPSQRSSTQTPSSSCS